MKSLIISSLLFTLISFNAFTRKQANIIIFLVDDLGWGDVGYKNPAFKTPNIDELQAQSVSFDRAYVSTPACSPSRASLLTGKEAVRMQMIRHIIEDNNDEQGNPLPYNQWKTDPVNMPSINYLPLEEVTYAERLKEEGYYNAFVGKWHLGSKAYYPQHQGFDEVHGSAGHGHPKSYYPPYFAHNNPLPDVAGDQYLTDELTHKAEAFIKNYDKEQPFTLSVWYYGVHSPHVGKKEYIEHYTNQGWEKPYAHYGAMVSAVDESLGRIRKVLLDKNIDENTIIIFTSDQGGYFSNAPLSGRKNDRNTLGEGGARVPFLIYYPGKTQPVVCATPIQTIDLYPTLVEMATGNNENNPNIQGESLMPLLHEKEMAERDLFFFRSYEDQYSAVLSGEWKLIKYHSGYFQLFNIVKDPSEVSDLIYNKPSIANPLKEKLANWEKQVLDQSK